MPWITGAILGGASLLGGAASSSAAKSASKEQVRATEKQIDEAARQYNLSREDARRMFDLSREDALRQYETARADQAPFRGTGVAANQRLAHLMGLNVPRQAAAPAAQAVGSPTAQALLAPSQQPAETREQIAARLTPQFSKTRQYWNNDAGGPTAMIDQATGLPIQDVTDQAGLDAAVNAQMQRGQGQSTGLPSWLDQNRYATDSQYKSAVDQQHQALVSAGYSQGINDPAYTANSSQVLSEIEARRGSMPAATPAAAPAAAPEQPAGTPDEFGSMMRRITQADINADPVYQSGLDFGLREGRNAINARALAGGGYDSSSALKALTRYGTDYGSTKAGEAYNRFTSDRDSIYNKLAGVSGTGQVATNQVQSAGAGTLGANLAAGQGYLGALQGAGGAYSGALNQAYGDAANARAAGTVASSNAWGSAAGGIGNAFNQYSQNKNFNALMARMPDSFTPYYAMTQYAPKG